ncbi:cysteine-rich VLP domain-containing protein [uncultured Oscillibacter sp.]|uniref:cysteine-rich VLP domain-containing protein n=1 Tax=uncultured Oscillibacter sp. TaxID=876091 RepID=UPI002615B736|nr:cysteine-rich VLP domain-containing protein [uncultured Oscillibacter sp.]
MEDSRELTRQEKTAIRLLVTRWCANYDREYGCLPLDCECYMLGKCWTGAYCRYFREAVLPLDPALEVALTAQAPAASRPCPVCGRPVPRDGRQRYCSPACAKAAHRQQQRAHMRKKRGWGVDN